MNAAYGAVLVCLALALWDLLRIVRRNPPRWRDRLSLGVWAGAGTLAAERWTPGWMTVLAWTVAALCVLGAAAATVLQTTVPSIPSVEEHQLRQRVLALCGPDSPESTTVGVSSTGFVAVRTRGPRLPVMAARLERGCPFCFVEEILTAVGEDAERAVERYRDEHSRGVNTMAVLTRATTGARRRRTEILPMTGNRKPFPHAGCRTHALL
ncbi:hypothetical protein [Streptomyces galbus]|uniref:Uncharacterized protein n=1 Tax=Streptomyces galbus TaxID=33898 RepID=A0A4U5X049_STRGB|nr:hypothetical protein [Streptomyces galbus]TKT06626.1 hypothetical protein E4U92_26625 [Streptomyces galbus]GHD53634.1 hypothetical protein GCM10010335_67350 [Streptomyces galbus]